MKIFQTARKNLATIDFSADQRWFHLKQLRNIAFAILGDALQCMYVFCVADTPEKIMNSTFLTSTGILMFLSYVSIISEIGEIFFLLDRIEKIVNKRKVSSQITWNDQTFNLQKIVFEIRIKASIIEDNVRTNQSDVRKV